MSTGFDMCSMTSLGATCVSTVTRVRRSPSASAARALRNGPSKGNGVETTARARSGGTFSFRKIIGGTKLPHAPPSLQKKTRTPSGSPNSRDKSPPERRTAWAYSSSSCGGKGSSDSSGASATYPTSAGSASGRGHQSTPHARATPSAPEKAPTALAPNVPTPTRRMGELHVIVILCATYTPYDQQYFLASERSTADIPAIRNRIESPS